MSFKTLMITSFIVGLMLGNFLLLAFTSHLIEEIERLEGMIYEEIFKQRI